ncbi:transglutaminase-like cysteine peptidase [Neorhizobium galegae]|uniref:transglutaminase-like cysteine peptidase n=1 Tax=Neorhizobium galegae TaxID=399 RepID=UPI0006228825|nr:transglutaminase-like cysteine peptidase [Neorhizobium galegae]CDZ28312.1 Putative periplasmic protein [Neorhizobium galegae bv. officinalis]KAA9388090.1 transglutaminase-like cysteine peptidase [Neorhizobium galegae]KAB1115449.1 transglutaminase-like cysteine peptidase [Neorhizobium galegae]MCM2498360.1 transglutaminase-like cysteine peptidase [Neorhizobium galegae]MCQ1773273.1 transglutaminase-like cysteine peptidase [Neorhizobium galegae]
MIKKLIISAVVLTALIVGKESRAAGVTGFAGILTERTALERQDGVKGDTALTFSKRRELQRVNSAVNSAISELDGYFDTVAGVPLAKMRANACLDCADLKRDHLISLGWPPEVLRIEYAIGDEGRIERVLAIATGRGEMILGHGGAMIDVSRDQVRRPTAG